MNRVSFACRQFLAAALIGLALPAGAGAISGLNVVAPDAGFSNVERNYAEMDEKYARSGTARSAQQMRKVALGQDKAALVRYAGKPVSANQDGSWDFDIRLPAKDRRSTLVCQYRVYFDAAQKVSGTAWRRPQCADIVVGQKN
ncbi:hypothetical protein EOW65_10545 [Sinirhodobacter ferrireducens]|uniref:Uncharacterized protein n=1 Tax=Paenirhodobacter ferrireducens TaxID=1215032 RepID=A0A443LGP2_9RHOB|nr:hypothetical protein [Sinirhodobacter ferrireducens]RWR48351.1 hypothetical protein EOW65_10545 [Sinirhodobacter ferrireducens]